MAKTKTNTPLSDEAAQVLNTRIAELEKENAQLKESQKLQMRVVEKQEAKPAIAGVTIQHTKPVRTWTVLRSKVIKIHRGTGTINGPRFDKNIVLTPGCVVTVEPVLAKQLIKSKDFQKYGVEK